MVFFVDKDKCDFHKTLNYKIIQERNKFLHDNSLPKTTYTKMFPSSHLPVNYINEINDVIFKNTNRIIDEISNNYNVNKDHLQLNVVFYVENSYENNAFYRSYKETDYSYGFVIMLNDDYQYEGGELYVNDKKIILNNKDILLFSIHDKINIRNILKGEQHKLIGYVSNNMHQSASNSDDFYFLNNKLNIITTQNHIHYFKNIIEEKDCNAIYGDTNLEFMKNQDLEISLHESDNFDYYTIEDVRFIHMIHILKTKLCNDNIENILYKYNIYKNNLLPFKIRIFKKDNPLFYFTPLIDKNLKLNTESKFTLLVNINDIKGRINFPTYNKSYDFKKGDGILIPNSFLFSFSIELHETIDYAYFIEYSFF